MELVGVVACCAVAIGLVVTIIVTALIVHDLCKDIRKIQNCTAALERRRYSIVEDNTLERRRYSIVEDDE